MADRNTSSAVISTFLKRHGRGLYGITGPAGSGKTWTGEALARAHACALYSTDFRFIGDSDERRVLLNRKQARSVADYQDAANQFNWWDWSAIDRDMRELMVGSGIVVDSPYDRKSGKQGEPIKIGPSNVVLLEGAILGPPQLIDKFTRIFFLHTPQEVRFERILAKDRARRSFSEVLARFLITEYSETIYYRNLFSWAGEKMVFVDGVSDRPCAKPELPGDLFVPLRVNP